MGRKLILAEPCLEIPLIVGTAQFESMETDDIRCKQLWASFDLLKRAQGEEFENHSVIAGDFNFDTFDRTERELFTEMVQNGISGDPYQKINEEQFMIRQGFEDVMHRFVDDDTPTMHKTPYSKAWRPDKIAM